MANHRFDDIGLSDSASPDQPLGYGIHGTPTSSNFFDQEGSAYFGELEEALMQGVVGIRGEAANRKPFITARPPTLEIFPSRPMRSEHTPRGNSQSAESINESGSAQNVTGGTISPYFIDSGSGGKGSEGSPVLSDHHLHLHHHHHHRSPPPPKQNQLDMSSDAPRNGAAAAASADVTTVAVTGSAPSSSSHKPQERLRRGISEKPLDPKTLRRLAQNREAARKSRLRKKAYVQQLESSRIKLTQLEQDLQSARSQGLFLGGVAGGAGRNISSGAAMFDMEYARWLNEEQKHLSELRGGLTAHLPDGDLRIIVDECLRHYDDIFQLKCAAAKSDVFHLINGMWTSPAERCFLWMGGFRPSEMLKILIPQLDPLTDQQLMGICSLQQSSQQAEEALTQGLDQLQQSLADTVASGSLSDGNDNDVGNYMDQMALALGKLSNLEGFVRQADHLRQQTFHQLRRILTIRQAARCFLAIGEYHSRLRAISSFWASRPRESLIVQDNMCPTTSDIQAVHQSLHNHFSAF